MNPVRYTVEDTGYVVSPETYESYLRSRAEEAVARFGAHNRISVVSYVIRSAPCSYDVARRVVDAVTK